MKKKSCFIVAGVVFAVSAILLAVADRYLPCYYESTGTFFYDRVFLRTTLARNFGFFELLARFFGQFFLNPLAGITILSLIASVSGAMGIKVAEKFTGRFFPLAALPSVLAIILLFYRNTTFVILPLLAILEGVLLLVPVSADKRLERNGKSARVSMYVQLAFSAIAISVSAILCINGRNELLKSQICLAIRGEWNEIIRQVDRSRNATSSVFYNYANLALAQKGQLSKKAYLAPGYEKESFFLTVNRSPEMGTIASDVYLAIGEVASAQRYAFESNESFGGYSPNLLKTLVKTNLAFGNEEVALKYVRLLKKTLFYRGWAKKYEAVCNGTKTTQELEMLKKCATMPNYFTQFFGEYIELSDVLRVCPENKIAQQYCTALQYILSGSGR